MNVKSVAQWVINGHNGQRFGDLLSDALLDAALTDFKFAVAYMRRSGLDRIMPGIEALIRRGGVVAGAIGVDDAITSADALEDLLQISTASTVISYGGNPIGHPKVYLFSGPRNGRAIIGSANLTRDGLYRNIEYGVEARFDLQAAGDNLLFSQLVADVDSLLTVGPNSPRLDATLLATLERRGDIVREAQAREPGAAPRRKPRGGAAAGPALFPPAILQAPPPAIRRVAAVRVANRTRVNSAAASIFVMKLSAFDTSHRTGVPGTPEILIPNEAMRFFPPVGPHGQRYEDAPVRVVLNHPEQPEIRDYRLWVYPLRAENRLRMDHRTIDLTTVAGGDLLVVSRLVSPDATYEVTIIKPTDGPYAYYQSLCNRISNDKAWGIA